MQPEDKAIVFVGRKITTMFMYFVHVLRLISSQKIIKHHLFYLYSVGMIYHLPILCPYKKYKTTRTSIISCRKKSNRCLDSVLQVSDEISDLNEPKMAFSATNLKFDFEREIWMIAHPLYVAKSASAI